MAYNHRIIEEELLIISEQERSMRSMLDRTEPERHFHLRKSVQSLKDLRVASIMDGFTFESFNPECKLLRLDAGICIQQIKEFRPDLLFIESAWNGYNNTWFRKVDRPNAVMSALTGYCRAMSIPIVFWNKEDPVSTALFMPAAALCDFIFTTDADTILSYKKALQHDRVYHLHFAAQPKLHNPMEEYERRDKMCFAGAYYPRYKERMQAMEEFTTFFADRGGIDIYDRNYDNPQSPNSFPDMYRPLILGTLRPNDISIAYKGYKYGLNMNSISQSQTMFARRVFELMASNTVVTGNYSCGVKNYFGELTISTNSKKTLGIMLDKYCVDEEAYGKYRLLGLRKILQEHLYEDRLDRIIQIVFGKSIKSAMPKVYVIARHTSGEEEERARNAYIRQTYINKELIHAGDLPALEDDSAYAAVFNPHSYYGANYLTDLMLATRYSDADGFCKAKYLSEAYRSADELSPDQGALRLSILKSHLSNKSIKGHFVTIDPYNYKEHCTEGECPEADDVSVSDQGIPLDKLEEEQKNADISLCHVLPVQMANAIRLPEQSEFQCFVENGELRINSDQPAVSTQYIFISSRHNVKDHVNLKWINVKYYTHGELDVTGVCWFYHKDHLRIGAAFIKPGIKENLSIPKDAEYFLLGFRVLGAGTGYVSGIDIDCNERVPFGQYCAHGNVLVVTNIYPSENELYRNMYVHKRVLAYKAEGLHAGLMRFGGTAYRNFREFEGVNVLEGRKETLDRILAGNGIDTVCIHYLRHEIWDAIKPHLNRLRLIIWCHGMDIQPWWRREFLYSNEEELAKGKEESGKKQALWRDVFAEMRTHKIHLVFVSKYFYKTICDDYEIALPESKYSIIHNYIDTDLFAYIKKPPSQRKMILSIRHFSSGVSANDLTVKCIEELSFKPFFSELFFHIIGDGPLYEKTVEPLRKYINVKLERKFLTQKEIAEIYTMYGVFLCPSRMDSQGVSRDEAMSSGLVPITSAVAAIPEFADDSCAIMAPAEDHLKLAEGIETLYFNEQLFSEMSEKAAQKVRSLSGKKHTIEREIELICQKLI
jgi:glycosyltransferase involved in cell wall biosynthesis/spore maturation protein CgeB